MKRIAIIGTQGLPANYGGFETLVENLVRYNQLDRVSYTVFCSSRDLNTKFSNYKGARLIYLPIHANGIQSIIYDIFSMLLSVKGYDCVLVLGVSGCLFLPVFKMLSSCKTIVNIDGLEHKRAKWNKLARIFLRFSEKIAVCFADKIVADNLAISNYVVNTYSVLPEFIPYGGDHVMRNISDGMQNCILNKYNLNRGDYSIKVCRIEPENNCHIVLEAFVKSGERLVFIGNWNKSDYAKRLRNMYSKYENILLFDPIYDLDVLYVLRKNASRYIHGHSAGGTNPSLVEAMFFGIPILAYDVIYNRETTCNQAYYFKNVSDLESLLLRNNLDGHPMFVLALKKYTWEQIVSSYEELF